VKKQLFEQLLQLNPAACRNPDAAVGTNSKLDGESGLESHRLCHLPFRFGLAAFLWLNISRISLYGARSHHLTHAIEQYLPFLLMALATPSVFYCGFPLLRLAWIGLCRRTLRVEVLFSIAFLMAYFFSVGEAFHGISDVHFDTVSMIVTFALAAKLIEWGARQRTSRWITVLRRSVPRRARLVNEDHGPFVAIDALNPGQLILVKAGERFPADGLVEEGESRADESLLTGDPAPVVKMPGSRVTAGSLNLGGALRVRSTHSGSQSALSRVSALLETTLGNHSELERTDRISGIILTVAVLTFALCWLGNITTFAGAFIRGITVLLIACPCAFALATPPTLKMALGYAARRGIIISDPHALEMLERVKHFILDKTGTLTEGNFQLLGCELDSNFTSSPAWMQANAANADQDSLPADFPFDITGPSYEHTFALLASLEQYSEHPLGKAVVQFARENEIALGKASCVELHKGFGITGIVDNRSMFIGGRRLLQSLAVTIDARSELIARRWESEGQTVTFFGWDGGLQGFLGFGDSLRAHATSVIAGLRGRGIESHLISSDSRFTTEAIARQLGVTSIYSDLLPERKSLVVRDWKKRGVIVAMVGNATNDTRALMEANVGIAVGSGMEIPTKVPSVFLMDNDLRKITELFELSGKTVAIIRQNWFAAFVFTTAGISLAITGLVSPTIAATAMLLSALAVVVNSLRIRTASTN